MARYTPDTLVTVGPFSHQLDGDVVILGDVDRQVFVAIPAEGLDILESLVAGNTVGQTARLYEEKHGEKPDMEDFLEALEQEGFVGETTAVEAGAVKEIRRDHWRWRFDWISQRAAQRLVDWPAMAVYGLIIAVGVGLMVDDPGVLPKAGNALLFPEHFAALTWAWIFFANAGLFLHEIGHVIAARAAGVRAGMGIGNQLWMLVVQTDMTSIWMSPKRQRYIAFIMGSIVDAVSCTFLAAFVWSAHRDLIGPPPWSVQLATAVLLAPMTRIIWQFFFFLRTDVYYVIATANNCKNLMGDTEDYLHNRWARLRRSPHRIDQSAIPSHEMRVIRRYSYLWFYGRVISMAVYAAIILPVILGYAYQLILLLTGRETRFDSWDFATVGILVIAINGGGLLLWLRGLQRGARERRRLNRVRAAGEAAKGLEPAGVG